MSVYDMDGMMDEAMWQGYDDPDSLNPNLWKVADGYIRISEMSNLHIKNSIAYLERNLRTNEPQYEALKKQLEGK